MSAWLSQLQLACGPHARPYAPIGYAAECLGCPCALADPALTVLTAELDAPAGTVLLLPHDERGRA